MKKTYSILAFIAAVAGFTSCSNDEFSENEESKTNKVIVYATTNAASRATLSSDYNVLWSTGDQIKFVNDENDAVTYNFTLKEGAESTEGIFELNDGQEVPADGSYTVYYPASYDGTNWPTQTYINATDISGAPMKATATVSNGSITNLHFTNEGGILRYTVKGSKTLKSINVKAASLDVTLDCGDGVALTSDGIVFNIAVPASEYSDALLTFNAADNTLASKTASTLKVTKNKISLVTFGADALSFRPAGTLPGKFKVADDKFVYFSKGNLYYDGSKYCFEENQSDVYNVAWDDTHISRFYWQKDAANARKHDAPTSRGSGVLFTNSAATTANSEFTANGQTGIWRVMDNTEAAYLLENNSHEYVTINGIAGIVFAPCGFTVNVAYDHVYTAAEWAAAEAKGFMFLPAAGFVDTKDGLDVLSFFNTDGCYWLSNQPRGANVSYSLFSINNSIDVDGSKQYISRFSIRLVTDCQ